MKQAPLMSELSSESLTTEENDGPTPGVEEPDKQKEKSRVGKDAEAISAQ